MQNWEQHIETILSDLRTTEVPFGIERRVIARLSMKRVIHLVRASVSERERSETRSRRRSQCWSVLVLLPAPSWELFTDVDNRWSQE
jgi:hypothetical protein